MTKVAIVTGANKGIGLSIVKGLCKKFEGDVYLTARDVGRGQKAVEELKKQGLSPKFHQLDITNSKSIDILKDYLLANYGGLDLLVNNAGISFKRADTTPYIEQVPITMNTNYHGPMAVCDKLFPLLRPGARVVHIGGFSGQRTFHKLPENLQKKALEIDSVQGLTGFMQRFVDDVTHGQDKQNGWPSSIGYSITKLGLILCAPLQQLAMDKGRPGSDIVINTACPGAVKTDMSSHSGHLTPDEGAETPLYLALLPRGTKSPRGCFCKDKAICNWTEAVV